MVRCFCRHPRPPRLWHERPPQYDGGTDHDIGGDQLGRISFQGLEAKYNQINFAALRTLSEHTSCNKSSVIVLSTAGRKFVPGFVSIAGLPTLIRYGMHIRPAVLSGAITKSVVK